MQRALDRNKQDGHGEDTVFNCGSQSLLWVADRLDHKIRIGTQCRDDGLDLRADIPKAEHRVTCSGNGPWVSGPTLPPGAAEMLMFELCCQETSRLSRLEAAG